MGRDEAGGPGEGESRLEWTSPSPEATAGFGASVAPHLLPGDVILLDGPLGAGKTALVQGIADGLGAGGRATSPTFVLVHELEGRIPLRHADLYRLDTVQDVIDLGIDDLFDDQAVTAIEWGEAALPVVAGSHVRITLDYGGSDSERTIAVRMFGQDWVSRSDSLAAAAASAGLIER